MRGWRRISRQCRAEAGRDARPGIPAVALGSFPGGADLPAPVIAQQLPDGLRAGQLDAARQCHPEGGGHPQHVSLALFFQVVPQLRAGTVHLVAADEVDAHAVRAGVGDDRPGELALGGELKVRRQRHQQRPDRVGDLIGRDPLAGADQRVAGALPDVGQVHGVDPVLHPAWPPGTCSSTATTWPRRSRPW